MDLLPFLHAAGGIVSTAQLRGYGVVPSALRAAVADGTVVHVRRGWYALPSVPAAELAAVRAGGVLTCLSLLATSGLWVSRRPHELHVAVRPWATPPPARAGVRLHWQEWPAFGRESAGRDSLASALLHLVSCVDEIDALVTLDSAVNSGRISPGQLDEMRAAAPKGKRALFDRVDGRSQSGLETKGREGLRGHRLRVRSQVMIPRVGRVDLVIGDRLVLETDGDRFHSLRADRREDRRRDLELVDQQYQVIRLDYDQVMKTWAYSESVILGCVRRREHLWTPAQLRRRRNLG